MLVLSRRAKEKISFPEVGVTLHFIRVQSGTAKVGIDAPMHITIVRDEACADQAERAEMVREEFLRLPKELRHSIRNELHTVSVGAHLMKEQLQLGMQDDAEETFGTIQESLKRLDENRILQRPNRVSKDNSKNSVCTVLVVEDQNNERELLVSLLRIKGYRVDSVPDGERAIEYLATHDTPNVILMDMNMPGGDGATAVRRIRSDCHHKNARVFAVSGTSPEEYGLECGNSGVDGWFPKPVNVNQLFDAMSN